MSCGKSDYFVKNLNKFLISKNINLDLYPIDSNKNSKFFKYSKKPFKCPKINSKKFESFFFKYLSKNQIDLIMPFNDNDLKFLKDNYNKLNSKIKILAPSPTKIYKFLNKKFSNKFLRNINLNYVKLLNKKNITKKDFPIIVKESGEINVKTKGFKKFNDLETFQKFIKKKKSKNFIFQNFYQKEKFKEYTIDIMCNHIKNFYFACSRERIKTKNYVSVKSKIVFNKKLNLQAIKIAKKINMTGLLNIQCFANKNFEKIYWFDLNPRISGGIDFFIQSNPSFFRNFSYCVLNKDINQKNCNIIDQKKILVSKNR